MFRPWYPPAQRGSFSRHTGQRVGPSRGTRSRTEDAQPNEFVNKRQRRPPAITSVAHNQTPRRGGRGTSRPSATCRDKPFTVWDPSSRCMRRPPPPPQQSSGSAADPCPGQLPLATTTSGGPERATFPHAANDATPRLDNFMPASSMLEAPPTKRPKQESPELNREPPTETTSFTLHHLYHQYRQ
ncbi:hypothetical protein BGW80DRAFT_63479 [Lactifluus volemus]|nr:hypothetical protein BGW80DRAFT_63479 [Lactifluus volemus]